MPGEAGAAAGPASGRNWALAALVLFLGACGASTTQPRDAGGEPEASTEAGCVPPDVDGDGFASLDCGGADCDDTDPTSHPGGQEQRGDWHVVVLDDAHVAYAATAAVTPDGTLHVVYTDRIESPFATGTLFYGRWDGRRFETTPLAGPTSNYATLVVDSNAVLHLAYLSQDELNAGRIVYRFRSGDEAWSEEEVVTEYTNPWPPPLAVTDGGETVHIAYNKIFPGELASIVHAWRADGEWTEEIVVHETKLERLGEPAMALRANGIAFMAFPLGENLAVATNEGGTWETSIVDDREERIGGPWLAIDPDDHVHVAYYIGTQTSIPYAFLADGSWTFEAIEEGSDLGGPQLVLERSGTPLVLYRAPGQARLARRSPTGWTVEEPPLQSGTLALGTHDEPLVVFVEEDHRKGEPSPLMLAARGPDGIDQNCDGVDGVDADHDGHASVETGGDDCADDDPAVTSCPSQ